MAWKVGTIGTTYYNGTTSDGYKQYICMTYGSTSAYACYFIIFEYLIEGTTVSWRSGLAYCKDSSSTANSNIRSNTASKSFYTYIADENGNQVYNVSKTGKWCQTAYNNFTDGSFNPNNASSFSGWANGKKKYIDSGTLDLKTLNTHYLNIDAGGNLYTNSNSWWNNNATKVVKLKSDSVKLGFNIFVGTNQIVAIYLGSTPIEKIYIGEKEI